MCGNKYLVSQLSESYNSTMTFGDSSKVNVVGKWNIQIKTKNGNVETISNVFYIHDLKSNLLSIRQLQKNGYVTTIKESACEIYDPKRGLIARVEMTLNRLFPLKL